MAVADAPTVLPPAPEECSHPEPVEGVMAHEFAHYEGAIGPEGVRRTVTYYGPVVGGLPIQASHCELCGLLRLSFPDGRSEERRLFPGPQPGLIAVASATTPERELFGLQPRVSGLSATPAYIERIAERAGLGTAAPALQFPRIVLPAWDTLTWLTVFALSAITVLLFAMGILAVYTFSTPSVETPLAISVTLTFVGLLFIHAGAAGMRHFFPTQPLTPSLAESLRERPVLDGATRTVIGLLVMAVLGFFAAAVLAVYTYSTPGAEWPVIIVSILLAVLALVVQLVSVLLRHLGRR